MGAGDNFIYVAITAENPEDPHPFGRRECGTSRGASRRICPDLFFLGSFFMLGCSPSQSAPGLLHFLQGIPRNPHLPLLVGGSDPKKYIFLVLQPWKSWPKGKDRWYSWPTGEVPDHDTEFLPDLESEKGTFPLLVVRLV